MPTISFDEYPSRQLIDLRVAWRAHYVAKGCSDHKAFHLAARKTHTWPPSA